MDVDSLVGRHAKLSADLAVAVLARGDHQAEVIAIHSATWEGTYDLGITERREACKTATSRLEAAIAKLDGEIEALRVELNHLEIALHHST